MSLTNAFRLICNVEILLSNLCYNISLKNLLFKRGFPYKFPSSHTLKFWFHFSAVIFLFLNGSRTWICYMYLVCICLCVSVWLTDNCKAILTCWLMLVKNRFCVPYWVTCLTCNWSDRVKTPSKAPLVYLSQNLTLIV